MYLLLMVQTLILYLFNTKLQEQVIQKQNLRASETISVLTNLQNVATTVSAVVNTCHTSSSAYVAGVFIILMVFM